MKKRLRMKAILCLCAMFVVLFCPFTVSANETEPENQVHFFATAAKMDTIPMTREQERKLMFRFRNMSLPKTITMRKE